MSVNVHTLFFCVCMLILALSCCCWICNFWCPSSLGIMKPSDNIDSKCVMLCKHVVNVCVCVFTASHSFSQVISIKLVKYCCILCVSCIHKMPHRPVKFSMTCLEPCYPSYVIDCGFQPQRFGEELLWLAIDYFKFVREWSFLWQLCFKSHITSKLWPV